MYKEKLAQNEYVLSLLSSNASFLKHVKERGTSCKAMEEFRKCTSSIYTSELTSYYVKRFAPRVLGSHFGSPQV